MQAWISRGDSILFGSSLVIISSTLDSSSCNSILFSYHLMKGGISYIFESRFEHSSTNELSTSILTVSIIPFDYLILSVDNLVMA